MVKMINRSFWVLMNGILGIAEIRFAELFVRDYASKKAQTNT